MKFKLQVGLNDCSNPQYHSDKTWLSSSSLKKLLKSPAQFKEELDNPPKEEKENGAFIEGSLTHSLILEENLVKQEYAFFTGMRKQGPDFESFKEAAMGKVIISAPQKARCLAYKRAFDANKHAVDLIKDGVSEQTICGHLMDVPIKVRFDYLNVAGGYGADVKTSSFPVDRESFARTCFQYGYGLSAALYLMIAEQYYGKPLDFYFIAIAKQELDCQVFRLSKETRLRGESEVIKALTLYKQCLSSGLWPSTVDADKKQVSEEVEEV